MQNNKISWKEYIINNFDLNSIVKSDLINTNFSDSCSHYLIKSWLSQFQDKINEWIRFKTYGITNNIRHVFCHVILLSVSYTYFNIRILFSTPDSKTYGMIYTILYHCFSLHNWSTHRGLFIEKRINYAVVSKENVFENDVCQICPFRSDLYALTHCPLVYIYIYIYTYIQTYIYIHILYMCISELCQHWLM